MHIRTIPGNVGWSFDLRCFDNGFSSHVEAGRTVQDPQYLLLLFFLFMRTLGALKFLKEKCWLYRRLRGSIIDTRTWNNTKYMKIKYMFNFNFKIKWQATKQQCHWLESLDLVGPPLTLRTYQCHCSSLSVSQTQSQIKPLLKAMQGATGQVLQGTWVGDLWIGIGPWKMKSPLSNTS